MSFARETFTAFWAMVKKELTSTMRDSTIWIAVVIQLFLASFSSALLVGMLSGTYSSIFNAVPLVVVWETGKLIGKVRKPKAEAAQA